MLEDPHNLRALVAAVLPDLVDRFDFSRVEIVPRTFLLDDWRRRESDMLFRLPIRTAELPPALLCLLIEHQSEPDPWMPLRVLLYAVLFWNEEWKQWEREHSEGAPPRLTPVIPLVFHTGLTRWRTNRTMAELLAGPEEARRFAPEWAPLFWDLAERDPQVLLASATEWLATLAVVRAEREDEAAFREVFSTVVRRLEHLSRTEPVRWHDLLWFVLSWGLRRRPVAEREPLVRAAQASLRNRQRREEIRKMSETIFKTAEQEFFERGEAMGEARGQLANCRQNLRLLLEERFGPLPEALVAQIEGMEDLERLRAGLKQVLRVAALDEFIL
jgi:hypothetical protein